MKIKKCSSCEVEKPLTAEYFYRNSSTATGFAAYCKECQAERDKKYFQKNKEAISRQRKECRQKNKEAINARQREHYKKNLARYKEYYKERYEKNKEAARRYNREYYQKNKQAVIKRIIEHQANRYKEDPTFRLQKNMRRGLGGCLSGQTKNSRTFDYVGLTPEELMAYLEAKFTDGMTRDNYGKWHVDHIRPLSSFDFYKHELGSKEFEDLLHQAWHHTNLQPLWAKDNIIKGARWDGKCK